MLGNVRPGKDERGKPGRPPARGTRTIRMCSFDARTRGSTRLPLRMKQGIEMTRAVEDQSAPVPEEKTSKLGGIIICSTPAVGDQVEPASLKE